MQNYSDVFAATLNEFTSPIVPADQGDAGKGQVTARAVYTINTTRNANVGYISKQPGQTQYHGLAVDAALDKSDGTGGDYLTDVDLGNGTREIRVVYTAYAAPPLGTPLPPANWVQPTPAHLELGGPLTLKSAAPTPPGPDPLPPDDPAVLEALARIEATLATMQDQQATDTSQVLEAIAANLARFNQIVDDVEEFALDLLVLILATRPPTKSKTTAAQVETINARWQKRIDRRQARAT